MSVKSHRHALHFTVALKQPAEIMLSLTSAHFSFSFMLTCAES